MEMPGAIAHSKEHKAPQKLYIPTIETHGILSCNPGYKMYKSWQ